MEKMVNMQIERKRLFESQCDFETNISLIISCFFLSVQNKLQTLRFDIFESLLSYIKIVFRFPNKFIFGTKPTCIFTDDKQVPLVIVLFFYFLFVLFYKQQRIMASIMWLMLPLFFILLSFVLPLYISPSMEFVRFQEYYPRPKPELSGVLAKNNKLTNVKYIAKGNVAIKKIIRNLYTQQCTQLIFN